MKIITTMITLGIISCSLSGCLAAAAGAGAAGAVYVKDNYNVSISKKKKTASTQSNQEDRTENSSL